MLIEKVHKRTSLMSSKKKDLVDHIMYLEHNNNVLNDTLNQQAENFKKVCETCSGRMIAICTDNSHTWRNVLTLGKEYFVLKKYDDSHAGYPMIEIVCDDGKIRPYRANRFNFAKFDIVHVLSLCDPRIDEVCQFCGATGKEYHKNDCSYKILTNS